MKEKATDIFSNWAKDGKDLGMETGHSKSVQTMLNLLLKNQNSPFDFIDAGCGNGWVIRKIKKNKLCKNAFGVDGAKGMIEKAFENDLDGSYFHADLLKWSPSKKVDFVHSMEVLYYFESPELLVNHIIDSWLKPGGKFISGLDYYKENRSSHTWPVKLNTYMNLLSIKKWGELLKNCDLQNTKVFQTNTSKNFPGTVVIYGEKK
jgi:SAM-dependent methyltransferase